MPPPPSPSRFPRATLPQPRSPLYDLLGGTRKPAYVAFDLLWLDGADLRALPLSERRKRLKAILRKRSGFLRKQSGFISEALSVEAKRDGISRRYIRRLVGLAFLSPELVEAILQGRQSVELTATRLTELDLPLDWTEQHKLLAS